MPPLGSRDAPSRTTQTVREPEGGARDEPACRPGSVSARLTASRSATIHLGLPLPTASCGLPASSGGPPSNARARSTLLFLTLLQVGFTEPFRSPGTLVVSYTTVSPLPPHRGATAVCSLWHCPAGHPGWVLPTTLPCGARTFLDESPRRGRPAGSSRQQSRPARSGPCASRHRLPRDGPPRRSPVAAGPGR